MEESTIDDEDGVFLIAKLVWCVNVISEHMKIRELMVLVKDLNETVKWRPRVIDREKQATPSFSFVRESNSSLSDVKLLETDSPTSTPLKFVLEAKIGNS